MYLVGVDVGGTFTDIICFDRGRYRFAKVPSIPGEQWKGVASALDELEVDGPQVRRFAHGTTIATNALLELKGATTALVTTAGFRDTLEIGRTRRMIGGLFDMFFRRPPPLVPRDRRFEVGERVSAQGEILRPVDEGQVDGICAAIRSQGVDAVAVCLINAHENSANETALARALSTRLPGIPVVASTDIIRERGEFERTSTCVLNAYLMPKMQEYLASLDRALTARGVTVPLNIMGSNGGTMTLDQASRFVVGTFLSGPVGGAIASVAISRSLGIENFITFDMGGTSTDVLLVHGGQPRLSFDNQIYAYPLRAPQLDIHTIGAGGGSIIRVQEDGTVDVGPKSAGAIPGPACYGRGGTAATISDANLLCGRLPADHDIAGNLRLSIAAAQVAFGALATQITDHGDVDPVRLASAAISLAVSKMAGSVREVSVHRGYDPREFALVAFGGAGPLHAFLVAAELGIRKVIIPPFPGHVSALGQMCADFRRDFTAPRLGLIRDEEIVALETAAAGLVEQGRRYLNGEDVARADQSFAFTLDLRYAGQSFTLPIVWQREADTAVDVVERFHARHRETFGYASNDTAIEVTNIRLAALGRTEKPNLDFATTYAAMAGDGGQARQHARQLFDGESWIECRVVERATCSVGAVTEGPAIIEEFGATSYIPAGWKARVDAGMALVCESQGDQAGF
jgi:N-methylhydantoinase A